MTTAVGFPVVLEGSVNEPYMVPVTGASSLGRYAGGAGAGKVSCHVIRCLPLHEEGATATPRSAAVARGKWQERRDNFGH